jgi:transcriptional regulator with XRE-family HTH domain
MPTEPTPERATEGAEDRTPEHVQGGNTDQRGTGSEGSGVAGTPVEHLEGDRAGGAKAKVPDDAGSLGENSKTATSGRRSKQSEAAADPSDREQLVALGARLRQLRHARGYKSQLAFVLEAGLPRSYYGDIERGQTNPTIHTLLAIAKALNVPLYALFAPSNELPLALDAQEEGTSGITATTSEAESRHPNAPMPRQPVAPFPFKQAQRRFRSRHPKMMADSSSHSARPRIKGTGSTESVERAYAVSGTAESADGGEGAESPHAEGGNNDSKARKTRRRLHKGGTLVSTAAAARAFGVNLRTIERWVEAGKLLPWDWVDGRLVVFKRKEIEAIADEYQKYLALRDKIIALARAEGAAEHARDLLTASVALRRLLKRYKRKRAPRRPGTGGSNAADGTNTTGPSGDEG